jgi:hypothetical protein
MSARQPALFTAPPQPRHDRAARNPVPIATPADMARKREVMWFYTFAAPVRGSVTRGADTPAQALDQIITRMGLEPHDVSVDCRPETPFDVEIRDERDPEQPRHMLALAFEGLNIAEAREALAQLQRKTQRRAA